MARCFVTRALPGGALRRLAAAHEVEVWPGRLPPSREELLAGARDADGLLCLLTDAVDADVIAACPRLRAISNYAVGADNIDLAETKKRGIKVGVTPGVLTDATADLTFALMLAVARKLPQASRDVQHGRWYTWEPAGWLGLELKGAKIAIIGYGRIGRAVAKRAQAFGMRVLPVGRNDRIELALEQADVVSLHVPLTPETRYMIGEPQLRTMKQTAILVNTARGSLVEPKPLLKALRNDEIGGAALDVTDPEPLPVNHPFNIMPNVLVTPHIGSATHAARNRMAELAVDNLLAGLDGRELPHPAPG